MNAGQRGAVTIATNMAGRGTDIKLGEGFVNLVDFVLLVQNVMKAVVSITSFVDVQVVKVTQVSHSSTCHSKMIDEAFRFRTFEKVSFERLNMSDEAIESRMLTRQVEAAQKRVEGNNYDTRKQVLQYDDVMREQREIIYAQRYDVITAERDLAPEIHAMIKRTINRIVDGQCSF